MRRGLKDEDEAGRWLLVLTVHRMQAISGAKLRSFWSCKLQRSDNEHAFEI